MLNAGRSVANYPNLRGRRILVVEDDAVIAVDYHFQLKEVGATGFGFKPTIDAALQYLATNDVDAAIVDYQLADGTSELVIDCLKSRGIPFVVVSGCIWDMHGSLSASQVLSKPVMAGGVCHALSELLQHEPLGP